MLKKEKNLCEVDSYGLSILAWSNILHIFMAVSTFPAFTAKTEHAHTTCIRLFLAEEGLGMRLGKTLYKNQTEVVMEIIITNWITHPQSDRLE